MYMKRFGLMLAGVAGLAWGYGDLPDTFAASTGYVTLNASDGTGAGNQSFFLAKNWSDNQVPHAGTNYYVQSNRYLGTPYDDSDVTAQLAIDPDCLTFKGRTLVVAGRLWHLNGTYEFTFPDIRLLPGACIHYTAAKSPLHGTMTVYGTRETPSRVNFKLSSVKTMDLGFSLKGDASSFLATSWENQRCWLKLTGDLSEFYGTLYVGTNTNKADNSVGFWITTDRLGGTVELPISNASLYMASASGLTVGGLKVTSENTKLFLDGSQVNATVPRLTVTNSLELARTVNVMYNHGNLTGNADPNFSAPVEPTEPGEYPLIRLTPEVILNGGWTKSTLAKMFLLSTSPALKLSELLWRDDPDGGKTLCLETGVLHARADAAARSSFTFSTKTDGGTDWYWSHESCPADDANSADISYFATNTVYLPRTEDYYRFPGKMCVMTDVSMGFYANASFIKGFHCDNLVWRGAGLNMWGPSTSYSPKRYDEAGNEYKFFALQGMLRVLSGYGENAIRAYGGANVARIESEVIGAGDLVLQTIHNANSYKSDRGSIEFTAYNTNYTGTISVTTKNKNYTDNGIVVPNWTQRATLFVSDERNLGGRRDAFAWNALLLEQYSDLIPLNDVTFTDGWNRGIAIGNIGRINVPSNLTMAIWRPLNVNGNLVKEGGGTLALGGLLTFGGSSRSATPTAGANLLTVKGGFVNPLATNAFDGLAITFTNNAALKLDGTPADATLRQYGLVNTKETTAPIALAPNQATLPVTVDFGAATEPPAVQWTVGLVTLETAKAEALKPQMVLSNPAPFKNWRGTLGLVDNGNGTSTVMANYRQSGFALLFR